MEAISNDVSMNIQLCSYDSVLSALISGSLAEITIWTSHSTMLTGDGSYGTSGNGGNSIVYT